MEDTQGGITRLGIATRFYTIQHWQRFADAPAHTVFRLVFPTMQACDEFVNFRHTGVVEVTHRCVSLSDPDEVTVEVSAAGRLYHVACFQNPTIVRQQYRQLVNKGFSQHDPSEAKLALTAALHWYPRISENFGKRGLWIMVSKHFSEKRIAKNNVLTTKLEYFDADKLMNAFATSPDEQVR
jgi:hypothetical protein